MQGVGFRWSAAGQARRLGLSGWVRNRADGAVEGVAQGPDHALARLRDWLAQGPPAAHVEAVEWEPAEAVDEGEFAILR